jgi:CTP:molybdopterin cytidylyltransferase MocA
MSGDEETARRMGPSAGVLLAAGGSVRFGSAKMLALVDGEPLVRRLARAFVEGGLGEVVVVLGARAEEISPVLEGLPVGVVLNPGWSSGMFGSVKVGLAALRSRPAHIAISPADLPGIGPDVVRRLLDASALENERTLVVPSCGGRRGHPLVMPGRLVPRLLAWSEDAKLSDLLSAPGLTVRALEGFGPEVLRDVDTPADLAGRTDPA